jgi:hypothetical protein
MPRACVLYADHVASLPKRYLGDLIATLDSERLAGAQRDHNPELKNSSILRTFPEMPAEGVCSRGRPLALESRAHTSTGRGF